MGDFGFDGDFELVGRIPWQSEAFAVVGDEFDSHDDILMVDDEKASARKCMQRPGNGEYLPRSSSYNGLILPIALYPVEKTIRQGQDIRIDT